MTLKESISLILDKNNRINHKKLTKNEELVKDLYSKFSDIKLNEICYRIMNDDIINNECINCDKTTRFISINEGFASFCSKKCANMHNGKNIKIKQKRITTNLKKLNQKTTFDLNDSIRSIKNFEEFRISYKKVFCKKIELQIIEYFIKAGVLIEEFQVNKLSLPIIYYEFNNNSHSYYPSLYIKSRNMIVDVKSTYFFDKHSEQYMAKQEACKNQGFHHIFVLMSRKNRIDQIL